MPPPWLQQEACSLRLFLALGLALLLHSTQADVQNVDVFADSRRLIQLTQPFSFLTDSVFGMAHNDYYTRHLDITLSRAVIYRLNSAAEELQPADYDKLGFVLLPVRLESEALSTAPCLMDYTNRLFSFRDSSVQSVLQGQAANAAFHFVMEASHRADAYNVYFSNCLDVPGTVSTQGTYSPLSDIPVSFSARVASYTVDRRGRTVYLDPDMDLILQVCFAAFVAVAISWAVLLCMPPRQNRAVHHLLTALFALKAVSALVHTVTYHSVNVTGKPPFEWDFLVHVFSALTGAAFFSAVMLVGTGWSFVRPAVLERHETLVLVSMVCMQVLSHAALLMSDLVGPASPLNAGSLLNVRALAAVADLLCCGAVLFPMAWFRRCLEQDDPLATPFSSSSDPSQSSLASSTSSASTMSLPAAGAGLLPKKMQQQGSGSGSGSTSLNVSVSGKDGSRGGRGGGGSGVGMDTPSGPMLVRAWKGRMLPLFRRFHLAAGVYLYVTRVALPLLMSVLYMGGHEGLVREAVAQAAMLLFFVVMARVPSSVRVAWATLDDEVSLSMHAPSGKAATGKGKAASTSATGCYSAATTTSRGDAHGTIDIPEAQTDYPVVVAADFARELAQDLQEHGYEGGLLAPHTDSSSSSSLTSPLLPSGSDPHGSAADSHSGGFVSLLGAFLARAAGCRGGAGVRVDDEVIRRRRKLVQRTGMALLLAAYGWNLALMGTGLSGSLHYLYYRYIVGGDRYYYGW